MSKFDSPRDEVLHLLTVEGWANESDGDVQSPTGWFARISNSSAELNEIRDAFKSEVWRSFDWASILGHWMVVEGSDGVVHVGEYLNEAAVMFAFQELQFKFGEYDA